MSKPWKWGGTGDAGAVKSIFTSGEAPVTSATAWGARASESIIAFADAPIVATLVVSIATPLIVAFFAVSDSPESTWTR